MNRLASGASWRGGLLELSHKCFLGCRQLVKQAPVEDCETTRMTEILVALETALGGGACIFQLVSVLMVEDFGKGSADFAGGCYIWGEYSRRIQQVESIQKS